MQNWSFDIDRQNSWDLWCWVCLAAAAVLVIHWFLARHRSARVQPLGALLAWIPTVLTLAIVTVPPLRHPALGLVWTFTMLLLATLSQYLQLRARLTSGRISVLIALRTAALVLAVPMLFEPVLRFTSRKDPDRPLVLLVDGSGSMSVPDVQNGPTRMQSIAQTLAQQWPAITARFRPQINVFSASQTPTVATPKDLSAVQADGPATDLVAGVSAALAKLPRDDAQILLFSDGIDNVSPDAAAAIAASHRPIHTLLVGSDSAQAAPVMNVAVDGDDAGEQWTVRSAAKVAVTVHSAALGGRLIDVNLAEVDDRDRPIGTPLTQKLVLDPSPAGQAVNFDFTPQRAGVFRMMAWTPPIPGERSTADNRRVFQQLATDARIKVLYVEGRARPEYRELSRALARDANIELATLLRVTAERYAAGGAIDGKPITALPTTAEGWRKFDVILIGDLPSALLKPQQQQAIEKAVSEGSGLLMLGGQTSLGPGGYAGTPIEKALPVNVGGIDAAQDKTEFVPRLTDAGQSHPAMTGLADWFGVDDAAGKQALPTLLGNVTVDSAKQGADVLLNHPGAARPIVLAAQRYGKGRSAVFTADTTYRWYLPMRGLGQQSPYTVFWGQLLRWLATADVKNRGTQGGVETMVDKIVFPLGEPVHIRAIVRDEKGDATRFAQVAITLTSADPKAEPQTISLAPAAMRDGLYEATISSLAKGEWAAQVTAKKDGKAIGQSPVKFSVIPPADELFKLAADAVMMQKIATATGGYAYRLPQLPQLIDLLTREGGDQQLVQQRSVPLHNTARSLLAVIGVYPGWADRFDLPMQTVMIVILLVSEWALRRRWQLL